jgi:predicted secreted Zn-dependent protease
MLQKMLVLTLVPFCLAGAAPSQETPAADDPFAGIPNVTFTYYDVTGRSPDDVRKDMNTKRFVDPSDNKPVDSLSQWRFGWRMMRSADGQCDPSSITLNFTAEVKLPRLTGMDGLPKKTVERWQRYYAALLKHEAGHVGYAWSQRDVLLAALKASSCADMQATGKAEVAKIGAHDRSYDVETRHGLTQGATFP